jgi:predicted enzyme related to lactoylglutathione lyase
MTPRDGYLHGVPCWIDIAEPDPHAAVEFYGGLFGWTLEDQLPADAAGNYFIARIDGLDVAAIASSERGDPAVGWATYIAVDDLDTAAKAVTDAGGTVLIEPTDVFEAGRMGVFADPTGAQFRLWQAKRRRGAQLVNAPGSWNFSDLHTPDPAAAEAFYSAAFGWEARPFSAGPQSWTMWCLAGYGDDLERLEPGLRQRQQEQGAPEGFEDVIASLVPVGASEQARWAVTFSVDDTDRIAERAVQLGGELRVEPYDAGPVRMAELADPAGAVFTVGRYDPESG